MRNALRIHFSRAALLAAVLVAVPALADEPAPSAGRAIDEALVLLDAISPSKPDPKALAELAKMRNALPAAEVRGLLDDFVAVGLIAAKQYDLYSSYVQSHPRDDRRIENAARTSCPECGGRSFSARPCARCSGTGQCSICKGSGIRRVNAEIYSLKGPTPAHVKTPPQYKEVKCETCRGTGKCPKCEGEKTTRIPCATCGGLGKGWDAKTVNQLALRSHGELVGALKLAALKEGVPNSIVIVRTAAGRSTAPVFSFKGRRVVALPAHAVIEVPALSFFTRDRQPVPYSSFLADPSRDLVLADIGETSLVPPLELERSAGKLAENIPVYAFGLSHGSEQALGLSGAIRSLDPFHLATSLDSDAVVEGAPVVTAEGRLAGLVLSEKTDIDAFGRAHVAKATGAVLRLDNLYDSEFTGVSVDEVRMRNNALAFARRAISNATDLLVRNESDLAVRKNAIADATQRLVRAETMLKQVRKWDLYAMQARAEELAQDSRAKGDQLGARLAQIVAHEAEQRNLRRIATRMDDPSPTNTPPSSADEQSAPSATNAPSATGAAVAAPARQTEQGSAARDAAAPPPTGKTLTTLLQILSIATVFLALLIIVANVIQDQRAKKRFKGPHRYPNYAKENSDYERKIQGKGK